MSENVELLNTAVTGWIMQAEQCCPHTPEWEQAWKVVYFLELCLFYVAETEDEREIAHRGAMNAMEHIRRGGPRGREEGTTEAG